MDGIVSEFRKTVQTLRDHAVFHAQEIDRRSLEVARLAEENCNSSREQHRANSIANRIEELIG